MTAKLLLPLLVAFAAAASNTFTVSGVLIEHGTNQPVKYANVLLSPVEHRDRQIAYRTGDDGRFLFTNLAAGKYSLEARIHNSAQALDEHEGYATAIAVGSNLDSEHIVFALAQRATIKGSVVDEDGEPVRDAQVFLLHRGIFDGRFQVALQTQPNTTPSGTFHFAHLRPGTYFVAVSARPWFNGYQSGHPSET